MLETLLILISDEINHSDVILTDATKQKFDELERKYSSVIDDKKKI
jgi:hypothetical protein